MNIVITGAFDVITRTNSRWRVVRNELAVLLRYATINMQDEASYSTNYVCAADVNGNSSKLRSARYYGTPIRDYQWLYEQLYSTYMARYGITPETALTNFKRYGRIDARGADEVYARGGTVTAVDYGRTTVTPSQGEAVFKAAIKQGIKAHEDAKRSAPIRDHFGQLAIKRKVNLD